MASKNQLTQIAERNQYRVVLERLVLEAIHYRDTGVGVHHLNVTIADAQRLLLLAVECENCGAPATHPTQGYAFCLACAQRFLGHTPPADHPLSAAERAHGIDGF